MNRLETKLSQVKKNECQEELQKTINNTYNYLIKL